MTKAVDRLDRVMAGAISVVVVRGEQIGIAVQSFGPQSSAGSRSPIHVVFDESISDPVLDTYFTISPAVPGKLTVSQNQITFLPMQSLAQGQDYTVTVKAGIESAAGRSSRTLPGILPCAHPR